MLRFLTQRNFVLTEGYIIFLFHDFVTDLFEILKQLAGRAGVWLL